MDEKTLQQITQWMAFGQVVLPKVAAAVTHYAELKDNPALNETDRQKMVENLQGLELKDWHDL